MTHAARLAAALALPLALAALLLPPAPTLAQQLPAPGAQPQPSPGGAARQPRQGNATEQLFEAINQGEIADVRAAVAAGADISARNVLGLTPLDLAVDLGRTDVALYLMSLGRGRERPLPPLQQDTATQREPSRSAAQQRRADEAAIEAALRRRGPAVSGQGIVAVAPLWQGNGGTPNPAIGFLGFDAGRPAGATPPGRTR
jgi:hypothetical protein